MRSHTSARGRSFLPKPAHLLMVCLFLLYVSQSLRSPQVVRAQSHHPGANVTAWQTLQAAQQVPTSYKGKAQSVSKLQSGTAVPLAMASADFDSDGVADLVVGFAHSGGGILALHRGNLDAFAPQSRASWQAIANEHFPPAFLSQATLIDVPERPDFVLTGDFSGSGNVDLITGARGSEKIYVLMNDGKGKFSSPQVITLPGALSALASGQVGSHDGKADVVAGIQTNSGASVLVYKGAAGGLSSTAVSYAIPQAATQLEIADLHGDGFSDIAVLSGAEVLIIHPTGSGGDDTTSLVEAVPVGGSVRSIAVGSFVWDRNGRNELAVLLQSGNVHVLSTDTLDTRPLTAEERLTRRKQALHMIPATGSARPAWTPGADTWNVVKSFSVSSPMSSNVRLVGASLAHSRPLDLMVVDSSDSRLHVLPANTSGDPADDAIEMTVETGDGPVAVLPVRVNSDARPGLVILGKSSPTPRTMAPLPDPTYTVNRFDDPAVSVANASTYCSGVAGDCSLREAVIKANSVAGADTIMVPAGTITLTQIGQAEYAAVTGDVDVRDTVSIVGAVDGGGNPTSIIQGCGGTSGIACSSGTAWDDKFISTNKDGTTNANLTISNVIFRNGHNTNTDFYSSFAGAVDFYGCGPEAGGCGGLSIASLTLTNVRFINNTVTTCANDACGGGLDAEGGPVTISNALFSGNTAPGLGGAVMLLGSQEQMTIANSRFDNSTAANHSGTDGGAIYVLLQDNNAGDAASTGNLSIHNSTFSNNTAGTEGGAIYYNFSAGIVPNQATANIDQKTIISGNSAPSGGGIDFQGLTQNGDSNHTSLSISKTTITGNSATNSGGIGGGGILVNSGGTLNLQYSRIVNNTTTASGKPTGVSIESGVAGTASIDNVNDNWWGCNAGPGTTPCDTVAIVGGSGATLTDSNWIVLAGGSSPSKIRINQSSTVTGLLSEHTGAISDSNLDVMIGLPINFHNAVLGTVPQAQPESIDSTGQATATYNAGGVGGNGSVDVTVDAQTDNVPIIVLQPPSIVKSFNPTTVTPNTPSTVRFAVTNGNTVTIDSSFTDSLPANLVVATTPSVVNSCGGTVTATAGSGSISFANSTLAVGTCIVSVNVQSATDNIYSNSVTIDSSDAGNGNTSNATLTVINPPSITKSFGASSIPINGTTSLSFSISNSNVNSTLTELGFIDAFPQGLVVATPNNLNTTCNGQATALAGASSANLFNASLAPGASCTFSFNVQGTTAGQKDNSVRADSGNGGVSATSTASVIVIAPPTITQTASLSSTSLNSSTTLIFTITNPNAASISLTGIGFTDTLSSGLTVGGGADNLNCGGTFTAVAGAQTFSLSGVTLAGGANCSVEVNATGTAAGDQTSSTSAVTSNEGGSGNTTSVTVNVVAPPALSTVFVPSTIPLNGTSQLQFTITNPTGNTVAESNVAVQDTLPTGLNLPDSSSTACGGTLQTFSVTRTISLSNAMVGVGTPCTFNVTVTGATAGQYTNTTAHVTAVNGGQGNTASAGLTVVSPASITKSFGAATIPLNGSTTLNFALSNPNSTGLTGVAFIDGLPAGLVVAGTPNLSNTCGGTATATAGGASVSLSGGSLVSTATCAVSVNVQGTTAGTKINSVTVNSTEGGPGNTSTASVVVVAPPTITKNFGLPVISDGGSTTLSFTISNPNATPSIVPALTGITFTDSLPTGLQVSATPGATNTCNGTFTAAPGATSVGLAGGSLADMGTCSITVSVTGFAPGILSNVVAGITSNEGGTGPASNTAQLTILPPALSTATALASSLNPSFTSTPGNSVTFTATVTTSGSPVNVGTVTFTDNGAPILGGDNLPLDGGGQAAVTTSFTIEGTHNILATYNGFNSVTQDLIGSSGTLTQIVNNHTVQTGNQFCNPGTITVPASPGIAGPYPSNVFVSGLPGSIGKVTVTLNNITSSDIEATELLLVGPDGKSIVPFAAVGDASSISGVNITLDDTAGSPLLGGSPLTSGSFRPTSLTGGTTLTFPAPAPAIGVTNFAATDGTATLGSQFDGGAANGTWALYSQSTSNTGADTSATIGGWCLDFTTGTPVTIATVPPGLSVSVDGGAATASPLTVFWDPTSSHTIATTSPQAGAPGTQYVWNAWSDGGAISHTVTAPSTATTYTATFTTQYQLTTAVSPSNGGTVSPVSGGFYDSGTTVPITATPNSFFKFGSWSGGVASPTSASTTITMNAPKSVIANFIGAPAIAEAFGAASIPLSGSTSLTFMLSNPNSTALTGVGFSNTLPPGLIISTPNGLTGSCGTGTISATQNTNVISLSGGSLAGSGSCTFSVNVRGTAAGTQNDTTSAVTSNEGGTGGTASASISVIAPPSIAKVFTPSTIALNATTTLTFTIINPTLNTTALTGVAFTDILPAGLTVASSTSTVCGGALTTLAPATVILAGASIAASDHCTFNVTVTGTTSGQYTNTTAAVTSTNGGTGNMATANLTVGRPPTISKAFGSPSIYFGSSTPLTFTISNPNITLPLTGVAFTDPLPSGLIAAGVLSNTCGGTPIVSPNSISLSGGGLPGGGTCTLQVNVTGAVIATLTNITGPISANETGAGSPSNAASISVTPAPTTSAVTVTPTSQDYGDPVTFTATLSPGVLLSQSPATSVTFTVGTATFGPVPLTLSGTMLTGSVTAPVLLQPNSYTATAVFGGLSSDFIVGSPTTPLIVTKENAVVTPSSTNPLAVQVSAPGGNSPSFTLSATVQEVADPTLGDINKAQPVSITLTPVGSGSPITCPTATIVNTGGPSGFLTATCAFTNVPVNVYDATFTVGGSYYQGSAQSALTVFDPSLGFVTGGGTIINPNNGYTANFGINLKYNKNAQPKGQFLYIEHRPTGDFIVKSNAMSGMAIVSSSPPGPFKNNEAITTGKATVNAVGNYTFQNIAIDYGSPGTLDQFGLQIKDPSNHIVPAVTFSPVNLKGGNIQVPH